MSSTSSAASADSALDSKEPADSAPSPSARSTPTAGPSSPLGGLGCQSTLTCESYPGPTSEQSTLFAEGSHASHSAELESNWVEKITATSGLSISGLSKSAGRLGCLEKTLLGSRIWRSTTCLPIWRARATRRGRLIFQLAALARTTNGEGSGLLPTPQASDYKGGSKNGRESELKHYLKRHYGGTYPHPTFVEAMMGYPIGHTVCTPLETPLSRKSSKRSVGRS